MALNKSELYSFLWKSCDELRDGMDASQYKDYALVLLFVKYVTDKYANASDALIEVPPGGSFADMVAAKNDNEIEDKPNKIIGRLADANESLKGAINVADFNDEVKLGKDQAMVERLTKLMAIFERLHFGRNRAEGDDLLGDAYEYLMRYFATEFGKSKGQLYTPAEISGIMAQIIGLGQAKHADQSIYDPTCGSGSLLQKAHDEARSRTGLDLAIYGQEMDNATPALACMNMVLHDCPTAEIWQDNTLAHPHFKQNEATLKTFDYVAANPQPMPVAVLKAKKAADYFLRGMQQACGYADTLRFDVKHVFSTNGHEYGEYDCFTELLNGPHPFYNFPSHPDLTAHYSRDSRIDLTNPEAAVFDFKTVNLNAVATVDVRTLTEIIVSIETQDYVAEQVLGRLHKPLAAEPPSVREQAFSGLE